MLSSGMKDPPWLPDPPLVHPYRRDDDLQQASMQIVSARAKWSGTDIPTSKAYFRLKYFPHSEWDKEAGAFIPTEPLPPPIMLGRITVLIESMIAWKIEHGLHPVGTLFSRWRGLLPAGARAQTSLTGGASVETYMGYQASLTDSGAQT